MAVKQTNSNIVIKEIHFLDGIVSYNLNFQDANHKIYYDFQQDIKSILIFYFHQFSFLC